MDRLVVVSFLIPVHYFRNQTSRVVGLPPIYFELRLKAVREECK